MKDPSAAGLKRVVVPNALFYSVGVLSNIPAAAAAPIVPVADESSRPIRKRRRPVFHYTAGDKIIRAFYALHFGNFAGLGTRIVWALFGLTPVLLFLTGAIMWWNRVLSREARRLRRAPETAAVGISAGA